LSNPVQSRSLTKIAILSSQICGFSQSLSMNTVVTGKIRTLSMATIFHYGTYRYEKHAYGCFQATHGAPPLLLNADQLAKDRRLGKSVCS
jgi:hypothetical protein